MTKKITESNIKPEPPKPVSPVLPLVPPRPQINKPGNFGFKPNARFQSINRGRR
jgi:hypothetical protein